MAIRKEEDGVTLLIGAMLRQIYSERKRGSVQAMKDLNNFPYPVGEGVIAEIKKHYKRETGKDWDEDGTDEY